MTAPDTGSQHPLDAVELIFEKSSAGRRGLQLAKSDVPVKHRLDPKYCRSEAPRLPEVTEPDMIRHYTRLSRKNFSIDTHFYPLGSCTMKYNPRFTERISMEAGFSELHPLLPQLDGGERWTQGALRVLYELEEWFCEITGMKAYTMQPLAGAHGELTGAMMIAAYHQAKGNKKKTIIVPDSAHGTNPATAAIAGYATVSIPTDKNGGMNLNILKEKINNEVAGLMLTCPNTLGVFNPDIDKVAEMIHAVDGLMYYDGANLNAILGRCRPGDLGFDVMHLNTHKTFTTPHGGGGPGAGPVGVNEKLVKYLPISRVVKKEDGRFELDYDYPDSIGYIAPFYGNFALLLRAFAYILLLGKEGLEATTDHAVLNANYIKEMLKPYYDLPYDRICMHEVVFTASRQAAGGAHAIDIAKYLIDCGVHPPTVYFPLTVKEAIMIEPTETESKETLDYFIKVMIKADELAKTDPNTLKRCPESMPVSRPDEVQAARQLNTNYFFTPEPAKEAVKSKPTSTSKR